MMRPTRLKFGWFGRLKNSARNCTAARSVMRNLRATEASRLANDGPMTVFLPNAPNWNASGEINAPVLNQRAVLFWLDESWYDCPATGLARIRIPPVPPPMPAVSPARLMVNGKPSWNVRMPENCQPPRKRSLNGSEYTTELTQRWRTSNDASARSARRLYESCGGEFSLPLAPPALRYCGALVIALEKV